MVFWSGMDLKRTMMFDGRVKYPRTPHVPWSVGTSDDKTLANDDQFIGKNVVVTLKMDGENTSIYADGYMHARSLYPPTHPSQSWVKKLAGEISWQMATDLRVCGENLYAKHTVPYDNLETYFMVFSVWRKDFCFPWESTKAACKVWGLKTVPVIYEGEYNKEKIIEAYIPYKDTNEGYVIRNDDSFKYDEFEQNVAKYVNPEFRQTLKESTVHWATAQVIPNKLRNVLEE